MKTLIEGHKYELSNFENKDREGQHIQFINKEPKAEGSTELVTVADGTTNEEVIEMLIDRMKYLQGTFPSKETACAITHCEKALMWLEKRTRDRLKRGVEGKYIK